MASSENATMFFSCVVMRCLRALPKESWVNVTNFANKTKKLGQDDPRRIIHSLKVGLALTLVSMLFYVHALYDTFGVAAVWSIMTVVVVMEFSVGATLGKGLNRMVATLLGGCLGFGVQQLAALPGKKEQPILMATSLYIIGAVMTFIRFVPGVKAKYDYGSSIFILTFSLVSISGYRSDDKHQILQLACKRILTIIIGSFLSMIICTCIWPVWIGEDLHNLVATNMQKLGDFLQGFGEDYFNASEDMKSKTKDKSFAEEYENVLNSKTKEETMANLAAWEPCHGKFKFRHPWKQYLKVGNSTRLCAYKIEALDYYIRSSMTQIPNELHNRIKDSCNYTCLESGKALKELSSAVKSMTCLSSKPKAHIANSKGAIESLNSLLKSNKLEGVDLLEIVAIATTSSILTDVDELASLAHFKSIVVQSNMTTTTKVTRPLLPLLREGIMRRIFYRDDELLRSMRVHHESSSTCSPSKENGTSSIEVIVQSLRSV